MESNLKRVIGDLNKSRGLGENGTANGGSNSSGGGSSGSAEASNPIAKVIFLNCCLRCTILRVWWTQVWSMGGCFFHTPHSRLLCTLKAFPFASTLKYFVLKLHISLYSFYQIVAVLNNHHESLAWLDEKSR